MLRKTNTNIFLRHPPRLELEALAHRGQHFSVASLVVAARPRRQVPADDGGAQHRALPRPAVENPGQGPARDPRETEHVGNEPLPGPAVVHERPVEGRASQAGQVRGDVAARLPRADPRVADARRRPVSHPIGGRAVAGVPLLQNLSHAGTCRCLARIL